MSLPESTASEAEHEHPVSYSGGEAVAHPRLWRDTWWSFVVRSRFLFPLLLMVVSLCVYLPRLTMPDYHLFDEILFAYTAGEYAEGNADAYRWDHPCSSGQDRNRCAELYPESLQDGKLIGRYQWEHPPLSELPIAGGILLFGNDMFGWRIMSTVVGSIGVALAYQLGLLATGRIAVGLLTAGLLLLDGLYFTYSRTGLPDIFLTVFVLGAMTAFTWYLRSAPDRQRWPLLATGVLMGCSIATKWSGAYAAFFIGLVVVWRFLKLWKTSRRQNAAEEVRFAARHHLIWVPVALVVVPIAIYLGAYLPFFIAGNNTRSDFFALVRAIFHFQTTLDYDPPDASRWWTWPLDLRSVWFGARSYSDGRIAMTFALGNPLLYWAFLPAIIWMMLHWRKSRQWVPLTVLTIGFFGQWLPWALITRPVYLYHFLPMVPFGCLAVAATVVHICTSMRDWRRTVAVEYVVLVALAFVFFYPILSYAPLSQFELELRMWLDSWRH